MTEKDASSTGPSAAASAPQTCPAFVYRATERAQALDAAGRRLIGALGRLANDEVWFTNAVADYLETLTPVRGSGLSQQQEDYLIESGTFTPEGLAATKKDIARGGLQLSEAQAWLSHLCATLSLPSAAAFLTRSEKAVTTAVSEGRLYAVEYSGRLRFPDWQFDVTQIGKVLPHLPQLIELLAPRWGPQSIAGFMSTRQSGLLAEGRKTPTSWLRDGGRFEAVSSIVESSYWR
jgi:hypothetical protein